MKKLAVAIICLLSTMQISQNAFAYRKCDDQKQVTRQMAEQRFRWLKKCQPNLLLNWFDEGYIQKAQEWTSEEKIDYLGTSWVYDGKGGLRNSAYYPVIGNPDSEQAFWEIPENYRSCDQVVPENFEVIALCSALAADEQDAGSKPELDGEAVSGDGYIFSRNKIYLTQYAGKGKGTAQCDFGHAVAGYAVVGDWAGYHQLACTKEARTASEFAYTEWITHRKEGPNFTSCKKGWVVDRVLCGGDKCSDIQMGCRPLDPSVYGEDYRLLGCMEQASLSDKGSGGYNYVIFGARQVLVGLKCASNHCDQITPVTCSLPDEL